MDMEKLAIAEMMFAERSKNVAKLMTMIEGELSNMIDSAMLESCTLDDDQSREQLKTDISLELNEYVRRGLQRGIKRLMTEYSK